jgi:hypothetical protein
MKRLKKLLASVLVIAMMLSLGAISASATTVTGDGDVVGANLKKTLVELPTSANMNFILDPQGLVAAFKASDGDPVDLSSITPSGTIEMVSNVGAAFINKSSFPVQVEVSATLTGNAVSTDAASVAGDTANNAALDIIVSADKVDDDNKTEEFAAHTTAVKAIEQLDTVKTANFALLKSEYTVTQSGESPNFTYTSALKEDEKGDGTKIQLAGLINEKADWTAFMGANPASKIGVSIAFKVFELAPDSETSAIDDMTKLETVMRAGTNVTANAYGLLSAAGVTAITTAKAAAELTLVPPPLAFTATANATTIVLTSTGRPVTFPTSLIGVATAPPTNFGLARDSAGTGFGGNATASSGLAISASGQVLTITVPTTWPAVGWYRTKIEFTDGGDVLEIIITKTGAADTYTGTLTVVANVKP